MNRIIVRVRGTGGSRYNHNATAPSTVLATTRKSNSKARPLSDRSNWGDVYMHGSDRNGKCNLAPRAIAAPHFGPQPRPSAKCTGLVV